MNSIQFAQLQLWLSAKFMESIDEFNRVDDLNRQMYWNGYGQAMTEAIKWARQEVEGGNTNR